MSVFQIEKPHAAVADPSFIDFASHAPSSIDPEIESVQLAPKQPQQVPD